MAENLLFFSVYEKKQELGLFYKKNFTRSETYAMLSVKRWKHDIQDIDNRG